jgi:iron complex outermembrane receptor protein
VQLANFGACAPPLVAALGAAGFSLHDPKLAGAQNNSGGAAVQLQGSELPNTPPWTLSMGAQNTWSMQSGYTVVPRADFYWQDSSWGRIFEDGADRLDSWVQLNMQVTLNAPDNRWYALAFMKNVTGSDAITGEYLASSTSALCTNTLLNDPQTYGIRLGGRF